MGKGQLLNFETDLWKIDGKVGEREAEVRLQ